MSAPAEFPRLIGFAGAAGAGKTTAACTVVATYPDFYRISLADPLRAMLLALGLTAGDMAEGKSQPHPLLGGRTPRYALQTLGTEWGRGLIDDRLWCRAAELRIAAALAGGGRVVIDDIRFANEAEMIIRLGGVVVQVERPGAPSMAPAHASEAGLPPDLVTQTLIATDLGGLRTALFSWLGTHAAY